MGTGSRIAPKPKKAMALARRARKNPRRGGVLMKARGSCGGKMHGMGRGRKGVMKGLGWLKTAGKAIKKATKKQNVRKLMNSVEKIADVASVFAVTDEGKDRADRVGKAAGMLKPKKSKK